jgi:hypothetical protein
MQDSLTKKDLKNFPRNFTFGTYQIQDLSKRQISEECGTNKDSAHAG